MPVEDGAREGARELVAEENGSRGGRGEMSSSKGLERGLKGLLLRSGRTGRGGRRGDGTAGGEVFVLMAWPTL